MSASNSVVFDLNRKIFEPELNIYVVFIAQIFTVFLQQGNFYTDLKKFSFSIQKVFYELNSEKKQKEQI